MKRYSSVFAVLALLLMVGGIASASFPKLIPADSVTVVLKQGYYEGALVWFFVTDTNDINFASIYLYPYNMPTLAVPLTSAYDAYVPPDPPVAPTPGKMFINVSMQQGPLFTAVPTQADYSGIWSVIFIKFKPGQARIVTNTDPWDADTNPTGWPTALQADFLATYGTSRSPVVVDAPIAAVGPFDNGVWPRSNVDPTTLYRLPQVIAFNKYYKTITLPAWYTYCQERTPDSPTARLYIDKCKVIIPDVENEILAARLGANLAPGLGDIDVNNSQDFYYVDGRIFGDTPPLAFIAGGPPGMLAATNQLPVLEWSPNGRGARNTNRGYTPVMDFWILEGNLAGFPIGQVVFVNNWDYIQLLLTGVPHPPDPAVPIYIEVPDERINAPVMDFWRIWPSTGGCPDC